MKGGMPMHEIFKKLSNRMVGAMMIHTQLTELFNFIDLDDFMDRFEEIMDEAPDEVTRKKFEKLMMEMR